MFIIVGNFDIYDHEKMQWPLCDDAGAVLTFTSVDDAHEYMRKNFNGKVQVYNKETPIAGVGTFTAPQDEGAYYICRCKHGTPAQQESEPELDPYDGMSPADFYGGQP